MTSVRVEAPARLHLGMLDAAGGGTRRFGGLGVAVSGPAAVVEASPSAELAVEGPDAERALAVAQACRDAFGLKGGARIRVLEAIPPHVGLGSGTKLALAVAAAIAALTGQNPDPPAIARAAGRASRSAVGLWTFVLGGLVVEGGVRPAAHAPPRCWPATRCPTTGIASWPSRARSGALGAGRGGGVRRPAPGPDPRSTHRTARARPRCCPGSPIAT